MICIWFCSFYFRSEDSSFRHKCVGCTGLEIATWTIRVNKGTHLLLMHNWIEKKNHLFVVKNSKGERWNYSGVTGSLLLTVFCWQLQSTSSSTSNRHKNYTVSIYCIFVLKRLKESRPWVSSLTPKVTFYYVFLFFLNLRNQNVALLLCTLMRMLVSPIYIYIYTFF